MRTTPAARRALRRGRAMADPVPGDADFGALVVLVEQIYAEAGPYLSADLAQPTTDDGRAGPDDHSAVRVLLADRAGAARLALAALLQSIPGIVLVGVATSMIDVADSMRRHHPEVLVVDDRLLGDGTDVLDGLRVIVVGVDDDPAFARRAYQLGAEAWIAKDRADDELPKLLETS